jgi:hypothetical protein
LRKPYWTLQSHKLGIPELARKLGGSSAGRNFRPTPPELPVLKRKLSTDGAEKLLLKMSGRNFRQIRPELPPDTENLQNFRTAKPIHRSNIIFDGLYLSTSTHIKIYIVLTSNTQNPKGREMFFQRRGSLGRSRGCMAHAGAMIDVRRQGGSGRRSRDVQQLHTGASTSTCTMIRQQARSICNINKLVR